MQLHVATDIFDEIHHNERFYEERHVAALMRYCRSLGATTLDWILDDMWALYEDYPGGLDLLKTAVDAAHAEGLTFHAVYKPFEGGLFNLILPHTMPRPAGSVLWEDLRGLAPIVRPFVAAHPEMCLRRKPGDEDPGGVLRTVRLIKDDSEPVEVGPGDVTIWTSAVNGHFEPYPRTFAVSTSTEWRPTFPLGRTCRVLTIDGIELPADQRYVEIRFSGSAFGGRPFRNEFDALVELVNDAGRIIPSTVAMADPPREAYVRQLAQPFMSRLVRYSRHSEVAAFLSDPAQVTAHASELRAYARLGASREVRLDERRHVSIARGKVPYLAGILNPVYPEVREEWLRTIRFCIDRGVDAVDVRASYHGAPQEKWAYGFNEPVLAALGGEVNQAEAGRVIGDAYTLFLREARDLLHGHGRKIGVHLLTNFLRPRDEGAAKPSHAIMGFHEIMDVQWRTWVDEIADFAVLRGAMGLREESLRYTVDCFAAACARAGIPLTYQANRRSFVNKPDPMHFDPDRLKWLEYEMAYALGHKGIAAFQLYETANFTRLDAGGEFHGSEEVLDLACRFGFAGAGD